MARKRPEEWSDPKYADLVAKAEKFEARRGISPPSESPPAPKIGDPHPTRADYQYERVGSFAQGDAFWDDDTQAAYTIDRGEMDESGSRMTMFARPRRGQVAQDVISPLQFGTSGITTEDTEERLFNYGVDDVIPRRL